MDHPQRRHVALSLSGKYCGDVIFPTGDPQLVVPGVDSDSGGAFQVCGRPCEDPDRRYIAIGVGVKKEDGIISAIGDDNFSAVRMATTISPLSGSRVMPTATFSRV